MRLSRTNKKPLIVIGAVALIVLVIIGINFLSSEKDGEVLFIAADVPQLIMWGRMHQATAIQQRIELLDLDSKINSAADVLSNRKLSENKIVKLSQNELQAYNLAITGMNNLHLHKPDNQKDSVKLFELREMAVGIELKLKNQQVPPILHLHLNENQEFSSAQKQSLIAGVAAVDAKLVIIWAKTMPYGKEWDELLVQAKDKGWYDSLFITIRPLLPNQLFTRHLPAAAAEDVSMMLAQAAFGGVSLKTEVYCVQPLKSLLSFNATVGRDTNLNFLNEAIITKPMAQFIFVWLKVLFKVLVANSEWSYDFGALTDAVLQILPELARDEKYLFLSSSNAVPYFVKLSKANSELKI